MDFELSKEHQMLQKLYREFAENEVEPIAAEIDEEERFPSETIPKLAKIGMMGIPWPKEVEGSGADNVAYAMAIEEIAKKCVTTSTIVAAHKSLCTYPIFHFGTKEQIEKYVPDLASGRKLGAFGLTEPEAGTDSAAQQTEAVLDGDHYVLNGTKCFITNASEADVFMVVAMTDKSKGNHGISTFIVEKGMPGFSVGPHEKKMGIRGSATSDLIFEDCIVPKENMLYKEGKGFKVAMNTLDGARVGVAAQALGVAEGAIDETIKYVKERVQFGRRISQFQNTQFELADMQARTDAGKGLVYRAACAKDRNDPKTGYYSAMAKMYCGRNASDVTRRCLQLFGGYGYIRDFPIERMMRDAKITEIYEGTSEVQKIVVSRAMGVK